ncbi:NAD-dependent epimerase/dehydratase family protein, partial [Variovorax sp. CAN2819]
MNRNAKGLVLVTGASGFVGRAVVARLAKLYTVVALDRPGPPDLGAGAKVVDIDL